MQRKSTELSSSGTDAAAPPRAMKILWSVFLLLAFLASAAVAEPRRELVGKVFHRGANDQEILERGVSVTLEPTGAATLTNGSGIFRLPLPAILRPDDLVTLAVDKEGWRIRYPLDGELRVPAEPVRQVVEVELLPAGSKLFWSNDRVEKFITDAIRQSAAKPPEKFETREDRGLDFSRAIRDWAERYGLSAEVAKQEIDAWIAEVRTAAEADERQLGLAAFAEQQFAKSARHFGSAAAAVEAELAGIERAERTLEGKKAKARQAVVLNYQDQGFAEYSARRYPEAIEAYENALRHVSPEQDRQTWASLWNAIGRVHLTGADGGDRTEMQRHSAASAAAHRKVLEAISRDELPREWARTQGLLGSALLFQSAHVAAGRDLPLLTAAFAALRSALEVLSRETDPLAWATAQSSLGHALELQASHDPAAAGKSYQEALSAYRNALEIYTPEQSPQNWAALQIIVGKVLLLQARRDPTDAAAANELLSQAVSAHERALEVFSREQNPRLWALLQVSLGELLFYLDSQGWTILPSHIGWRKSGGERSLLEEAAVRHLLALELFTRESTPQIWAHVQTRLALVLYEKAMRVPGEAAISLLGEAISMLRSTLAVYDRELQPLDWAATHATLGDMLRDRGRRTAGEEKAHLSGEARSAYRRALEIFTREKFPKEWAAIQSGLETMRQESGTGGDGESAKAKA